MNGAVRQLGAKSVFDEAREFIAAWEKAEPTAAHIGLVIDGKDDLVTAMAGEKMKPSEAAGLFFTAAQMEIDG